MCATPCTPRSPLLSFRIKDRSMSSLLPPATKLGQGYIFTGVFDSVHGMGGGGIPACITGGIPACLAAGGVLSQHALQRGGCLLPGGSAPGGLLQGGCLVDTPQTATAAGGTHSTGMNSFILYGYIAARQLFVSSL